MYYQNYEDYMRQVLGYSVSDSNIYESYDYRNMQPYENTYSSRNQFVTNMSEDEIRSCYPEIYHLLEPMVCKICDTNTKPITRELIEKMTDEVYLAIEDSSTVVNIRVDAQKQQEERSSNEKINNIDNSRMSKSREEVSQRTSKTSSNGRTINSDIAQSKNERSSIVEDRQTTKPVENRQFNSNLRDLIKILILFRLFGNRFNRPIRPQFPGRPPFSTSRPPIGPNRPPMQQRDYQNYLEF